MSLRQQVDQRFKAKAVLYFQFKTLKLKYFHFIALYTPHTLSQREVLFCIYLAAYS